MCLASGFPPAGASSKYQLEKRFLIMACSNWFCIEYSIFDCFPIYEINVSLLPTRIIRNYVYNDKIYQCPTLCILLVGGIGSLTCRSFILYLLLVFMSVILVFCLFSVFNYKFCRKIFFFVFI